jgi:hypothetical protein
LGTSAVGFTKEDGTYELLYPGDKQGAPVGEYTVSITWIETDEEGPQPPPIPAQYNQETTLSASVESGANTFDFNLTTGR